LAGNETTKRGFFKKLSNGDFGLAKTFWLYGVLVGLILDSIVIITISADDEPIVMSSISLVFILLFIIYEIPVFMGIWRTGNRYEGSKIWVTLAKIAVVAGIIWLLLNLILAGGIIYGLLEGNIV